MHEVIMYSTPTCVYCTAAKKFFAENGISFIEHNVASDAAKRKEMIEKSAQMGVPVIMIDGQMIVGFNEQRIKQLLGIGI